MSSIPPGRPSPSRLSRAGAIVTDVAIATALVWIPIIVLAAIAAVLSRLAG
ncbi:MAG: hypothetical protein AB7P99_15195 [Vicinamibacterales bacterium]